MGEFLLRGLREKEKYREGGARRFWGEGGGVRGKCERRMPFE
jgi:hypothetical protein